MKRLYPVLLLVFLLSTISSLTTYSQTGTEFWFAAPEATNGHDDRPINLRLATSNLASTVTVEIPANAYHATLNPTGFVPIVVNIPANSSNTVNLTTWIDLLENIDVDAVRKKGLHVTATNPITAYYEINTTYNTEIWALKGANALGTEFYTPFQTKRPNGGYSPTPYATIDIVATENNTTILVFPRIALLNHAANVAFTITLQRGQTYSLRALDQTAANHPAGTVIVSDKPIAVSVKDDSVGGSTGCYDMMGDQIVPVDIIGKDYIVTRGGLTSGDEAAYIMPVENNTKLYAKGVATPIATLFAGQTYRYDIPDTVNYVYFTASKPVYMLHASGFGCELGEAILPPLNCAGSRKATVIRSQGDPRTFIINLVVKTGHEDAFVVNGGAYTNNTTIIQASDFTTVPGTGGLWKAAKKTYVNDATFAPNIAYTISNTEDVFALGMVNGGATSGCRYGYFSEYVGRIYVNAGNDTTICKTMTAPLNGSVTGGSVEGKWTSSGSGTFSPNDSTLNATYIPSNADTTLNFVDLTLTSKSICFPVSDVKRINFDKAPRSNAGAATSICANSSLTISDASASNYSTIQWTSSGSAGTLTNATTLTPTYTPSAADKTAGTVTLTMTVHGTSKCVSQTSTATKVITINPLPVNDAGADATICSSSNYTITDAATSNTSTMLWTSIGTGTITNANTISPTYIPSAADITAGNVVLTLTSNGTNACNTQNAVSTMTLNFQALPTANAGANSTICASSTHTVSGASSSSGTISWSTSGTGTFTNGTTNSPTYTPSADDKAAGNVILTLTVTGINQCLGQEVTSTKTLTINPLPTAYAGTGKTICASSTLTISEATASNHSAVSWTSSGTPGTLTNASTIAPTYTPSATDKSNGSVVLTITATGTGQCISQTATSNITVNIAPAPIVNSGGASSMCGSNTLTVSGATGSNATYLWTTSGTAGTLTSANTLTPTYTPSAADITAGAVTLTLTGTGLNQCSGQTVTSTKVVTITAPPVIEAGTNSTICSNSTLTVSGASGSGATYLWTSSGTAGTLTNATTLSPTYTPSAADKTAGIVTLTLTGTGTGLCLAKTVTDTKTITINPMPTANAGAGVTVCATDAYTITGATATNSSGILWTTTLGTGVLANANTISPTYTASAADVAAGNRILTLTVTGTGACNTQTAVATKTLTFRQLPTANAGANSTICANSTHTVSGASSANSTILWSTSGSGGFVGGTTLSPTYTPSGADISAGNVILTITATGTNECISKVVSSTKILTINPLPTAYAGTNKTICASSTLTISEATASNQTAVAWTSSGTPGTITNANTLTPTYTPSATDIANGSVVLTITATGSGQCISQTVTSNITVNIAPAPVVNSGGASSMCGSNTLTVSGATGSSATYLWTSSGTAGTLTNATTLTPTYTPSVADITAGTVTLTLTGTGLNQCSGQTVTSTKVVTITAPPVVEAGANSTICSNSTHTVSGASGSGATYLWSTSGTGTFASGTSLTPTYTPSAADKTAGSVVLTLTGTGIGLCSSKTVTDTKTLTINPMPTANAGGNSTICASDNYTETGASVTNTSSMLWTSSGTGSFVNANTISPTYTASAADISAGNVTLTLTATGSGACNTQTVPSTKILTFRPLPTANAGANSTICASSTYTVSGATATNATVLWTTSGSGTFTGATTLTPTYTPSAADKSAGSVILTLTATGQNECNTQSVSSNKTLTINPLPTTYAGSDKTICSIGNLTISEATASYQTNITWTSTGSLGTLTNATTLTPTYTPSAADRTAGSVKLIITVSGAGLCVAQTVKDTMNVTLAPAPVVSSGGASSMCGSNTLTVSGATGSNATYMWTTSGTAGTLSSANTLTPTYTPSAADITAGTVTLTLTGTGLNQCSGQTVTSTKVVTITAPPVVEAGANSTICSNSTHTVSGASGSGATYLWSTSGTGTFASGTSLTPTYTPSAADKTAGSVTLTLTGTGTGLCIAKTVTDTKTLTINPMPTANAGGNSIICSSDNYTASGASVSNTSSMLWTSSGTGSFVNANTLSPTYTASAADISAGNVTLTLTATGSGACNTQTVPSTKTLTFRPLPTANAGANSTICANSTHTVSGASSLNSTVLWTTSGSGTFTGATTLTPTYTPSAADKSAGNVILTLTATGQNECNSQSVSSNKTLTINPLPTAYAGTDKTICAIGNLTISEATASYQTNITWTSTGSLGTLTNATTLTPTYTPSAADRTAGSVKLILTLSGTGMCVAQTVKDTMNVTLAPSPVVSAGAAASLCGADSLNISGASGTNATYLWSTSGTAGTLTNANTLTPTYKPSVADIAAGTVTLTLTGTGLNQCSGQTVTSTKVITIVAPPVVEAGANSTICSNSTHTVSGASSSGASLLWQTSGTGTFTNGTTLTPTYTPSAADKTAGIVTLTLRGTGSGLCSSKIVTDTKTLTINPMPVASAGAASTVCANDAFTITGATVSNTSSMLWTSSGTGTITNANTISPTYTASVADVSAGNITLTLTATGSGACNTQTAVSTKTLTFRPLPTANAGANSTICASSTHTVSGATATNATVLWTTSGSGTFTGATTLTPTYTPSAADKSAGNVILTLTATGSNECSSKVVTSSKTLTINPLPTTYAGTDKTICANGTLTISEATVSYFTNITWTSSGSLGTLTNANTLTPTYTPSAADKTAGSVTLTMTASGTGQCLAQTVSDPMVVTISPAPVVSAGANQSLCGADSLNVTGASGSNATYLWTTSGTAGTLTNANTLTPTYKPSVADITAGSVTLTLSGSGVGQCSSSSVTSTKTITIATPPVVEAGANSTICSNSTHTVSGASSSGASLLWQTSGTGTFVGGTTLTPTYTPSAADKTAGVVTLTLRGTGSGLCSSKIVTDTKTLTINPMPTANAGGNSTICSSNNLTVTGASVTNTSSMLWTTSGTGTITNANTISPTYIASAADKIAGNVTLTLTATGTGVCNTETSVSSMTLTFRPLPTANAGAASTICANTNLTVNDASATNASINWSTSGTGTFTNGTTLTPTYTPSVSDKLAGNVLLTMTATGINECNTQTTTSTKLLTINPLPTAYAGTNKSICSSTPLIISEAMAGNYSNVTWTSSGSLGTIANANTLTPTYTPSATDITNGSVGLTLTATGSGQCVSQTATSFIIVSITPGPIVNAGAAQTMCAGDTLTISGASGSNAGYLWTTSGTSGTLSGVSTLTPKYIPSADDITNGSVTLTLTGTGIGQCNSQSVTSTKVITINPMPTANAGSNSIICANSTHTVSGASSSNSTILWTTSGTGTFAGATSLTPTYTPSTADKTAGSVVLTLTATGINQCGTKKAISTKTLSINPMPTANAGTDAEVCANGTFTVTGATASNLSMINWTSDGTAGTLTNINTLSPTYTPSPTDITSGSVNLRLIVTGTGACNTQTVTSTMTVDIQQMPTANAGANVTICENQTLNVIGTSASNGTILWTSSGSAGTLTNTTTLSPTYTPSAADKLAGSVILKMTVTGIGSCNTQKVESNKTVTINKLPTVFAGSAANICENNVLNVNDATGSNYGSLTWVSSGSAGTISNSNTLTPTYSPSAADKLAGSVTLTLSASGAGQCVGQTVTSTKAVTIKGLPTVNAGLDATICSNSPLTVNDATSSNGTLVWTSSGSPGTLTNAVTITPTYTPSPQDATAGTIALTLTGTGTGPCATQTVVDQKIVTLKPQPSGNAGPAAIICANGTLNISDASALNYSSVLWSSTTGGTWANANTLTPTYTPSAADISNGTVILNLRINGKDQCSSLFTNVTKTLTINPLPTANAGLGDTICSNTSYTVNNATSTNATVLWTSSGTGTFLNANTLTPNYMPSAADATAGSVTLTLTATGLGQCNTQTAVSTKKISIYPLPTANAGGNENICENSSLVIAGATSSNSTVFWTSHGSSGTLTNANTLTPTYTPSIADRLNGSVVLTLNAVGLGRCKSDTVSSNKTVFLKPLPVANAGQNDTICYSNPITLGGATANNSSSVLWSSSGTAGTIANSSTLTPTYTPSAADITSGSVTLTLTVWGNAECSASSVTSTKKIKIDPLPTVSAGSDALICSGSTYTVNNATSTNAVVNWTTTSTGTWVNQNTLTPTYIPSPSDTLNGSVVLTVNANGTGKCATQTASSSMTLSFQPKPEAITLVSDTICEDGTYTVVNASAYNQSSIQWSSLTGGTWLNATTLTPTYTPSAADKIAGFANLRMIVTGKNNCISIKDTSTLRLVLNKLPIANAGPIDTVCGTDAYTVYNATSINGTLLWTSSGTGVLTNATTITPNYKPSAADVIGGNVTLTLTASGINKCTGKSSVSNKTLLINPLPTANAGSNATICSDGTYIINDATATNASVSWTSSGSVGTLTNLTTLTPTYTPSVSDINQGSITLTLTATGNGKCHDKTAISSMSVSISPSPTASAGANDTICSNGTITLSNANANNYSTVLWTSSGSAGTLTNANTLTPTYTPSNQDITNGGVILTMTVNGLGTCASKVVTSTKRIKIIPLPSINAGSDIYVCSNNPIVTLVGSQLNANGVLWTGGLGYFNPNNTSLNLTYQPTLPEIDGDSITLTLTATNNKFCGNVSDNVKVYFTPSPTADAGPFQAYCDNMTSLPLNGVITVASSAIWTTSGTGTFDNANFLNAQYTPSTLDKVNGLVWLYITTQNNGNCLSVKDSVKITFIPGPVANAGSNKISCANNPSVSLSGSVTNAAGGVWSGGSGTFTPNNTDLNAVYTPTAAEITAGNVTLALTTIGNLACPASISQMNINIRTAPVVNAGQDQSLCKNNPNVALNGSVMGATGGQWSGGLGTYSPSPDALSVIYTPTQNEINNGFIILTLKSTGNGICNQEIDNMLVSYNPAPIVDAGLNKTVCANNPNVLLNGSVINANSGLWTTSGSGIFVPSNTQLSNTTYIPSPEDIQAGGATIYLRSTGNGNCNAEKDSMIITISPAPNVNAGNNITVCVDQLTVQLNGEVSGGSTTGIWTTTGTGTFIPNANTLDAKYKASVQDSINQGCNLILTATNFGSCSVVKDTVKFNIFPGGYANAGNDITVCANTASIALSGQVTGQVTGGVWSSTGTGTFVPNANTLTASYKPSAEDVTAGSVKLILQANSCNLHKDSLILNLSPAPIVSAGSDKLVCADVMKVTLNGSVTGSTTTGEWTTTGTGYFTPNNTALNATYNLSSQDSISGTTLYLTSTNNGNCQASTDAMRINVTVAGYANAGNDQIVCANNSLVTINGSLTGGATKARWSSSGTGLFMPSDTVLEATYQPTGNEIMNGSLTLTLTTTNSCNVHSDEILVTINPAPIVEAGENISICGNNANVILNGTVTNAAGGMWSTQGSGSFSPDNVTLTNATYYASNQDVENEEVKIYLTSTGNDNCLAVKDSMMINITTPPIVDAGMNQGVCKYSTSTTLIGSVTGGSSTGIWVHNGSGVLSGNTDLGATYTFSQADTINGSVTFTLTSTNNGNCLAETDQMTITFGDRAFAFAGNDIHVCASNMAAQLEGIVTAGATQGYWEAPLGSGTFTPDNLTLNAVYTASSTDSIIGRVELILTTSDNSLCRPGIDTVAVFIDRLPIANAGDNLFVCYGTPAALSGSIENAESGKWTTLGNGFFINPNMLNTFYLASPADSARGYVDLVLTTFGSLSCDPVSDTTRLTIGNPIIQNFTYSNACMNTEIIFSDNSTILEGVVDEWKWDFGGGLIKYGNEVTHTFTSVGVYPVKLTMKSSIGCIYSLTKNITVNQLPTIDFENSSNCFNEFVQFTDLSSVYPGYLVQWNWDFGDGSSTNIQNPFHNYASGGTYDIKLRAFTNNGCYAELTKSIMFHPTPSASFTNTSTCVNSVVNFADQSEISSGEVISWYWTFGDGSTSNERNPSHFYGPAGNNNVKLIVFSDQGCVDTVSKSLVIRENPTAGFTISALADSIDMGAIINFTDISTGATQWLWNFGDNVGFSNNQNPGYIYNQLGEFTISQVVYNDYNCSDTSRLKVKVNAVLSDKIFAPKLPTAFTPNGDGENDTLFVRGGPFKDLELRIYNKWGELIFESDDANKGWDGTRNGNSEPPGMYMFTLRATTIDGNKYTKFGSVYMIK